MKNIYNLYINDGVHRALGGWEGGGGARGCAPPLIRQDVPQLKFSPRLPVVQKSLRIIIESMELYLWQVSRLWRLSDRIFKYHFEIRFKYVSLDL